MKSEELKRGMNSYGSDNSWLIREVIKLTDQVKGIKLQPDTLKMYSHSELADMVTSLSRQVKKKNGYTDVVKEMSDSARLGQAMYGAQNAVDVEKFMGHTISVKKLKDGTFKAAIDGKDIPDVCEIIGDAVAEAKEHIKQKK